jgi:hypothetical protein
MFPLIALGVTALGGFGYTKTNSYKRKVERHARRAMEKATKVAKEQMESQALHNLMVEEMAKTDFANLEGRFCVNEKDKELKYVRSIRTLKLDNLQILSYEKDDAEVAVVDTKGSVVPFYLKKNDALLLQEILDKRLPTP